MYEEIFTALATGREVPAILQGLKDREHLTAIAHMVRLSKPENQSSSSMDSPKATDSIYSPVARGTITGASSLAPGYTDSLASPLPLLAMQRQPSSVVGSPPQLSPLLSAKEIKKRACHGPTDLSDNRLIRWLFSIYWVWVDPAQILVNARLFLRSYEDGNESHCSAFLVYAVCIAACDYLEPGWESVEGKSTDVVRLKQNLIANAQELETMADLNALTTKQALAILAKMKGA